ncbi:MAG: hypothetical protein ACR2RD_00595 [Woeseiaceae bacterium]
MNISAIKGLSKDVLTVRRDAIAPAAAVESERRQAFQAKLANAGKQLQRNNPRVNRDLIRNRGEEKSTPPSRVAPGPTSPGVSAANNRRIDPPRLATTNQQALLRVSAERRLRLYRKSTSKKFRRKLSHVMADLGLTLIDVWADASKNSVTVLIDQPGYSRTRFVIGSGCEAWHVEIYADATGDAEKLRAEESALRQRFAEAQLGHVAVSK